MNIGLIIGGIVLLTLGFLSIFFLGESAMLIIVIGLIPIIVAILSKQESVEFQSNTLKIRGNKKGIEKFVENVRKEVYKKEI